MDEKRAHRLKSYNEGSFFMQTDQIARPIEASIIVKLSLSTIHRYEKAGKFPRRIRLGENAVGYRMSELQAWLDSREVIEPGMAKVVAPGARRGRKPKAGGAI